MQHFGACFHFGYGRIANFRPTSLEAPCSGKGSLGGEEQESCVLQTDNFMQKPSRIVVFLCIGDVCQEHERSTTVQTRTNEAQFSNFRRRIAHSGLGVFNHLSCEEQQIATNPLST